MNRIAEKFKELKEKGEKALVGFVTAGDPNIEVSLKVILGMCGAGLDVLELGIPFSDPTADGPVIQRSSGRALAAGVNLPKVLAMTREIRKKTTVPIILFSYYNPILSYGNKMFYRDAIEAGADGVLVVDLPPEESKEMTGSWTGDDLNFIRLVAPTTPTERMAYICSNASGFIYLISKTGVTGSDGLETNTVAEVMQALRKTTDLPICVGFGISTSEQVAEVASVADGVVIGSAFERLIEVNLDKPDLAMILHERTRDYKRATIK